MALFDSCAGECATITNLAKSFEPKCGAFLRRKYGNPYYALVNNAADVSALDNTIESWCAFAADQNICISPCGAFDLGTPSPTNETDYNNCGETRAVENVYTPTFTSKQADPDGYADCEYYQDVMENQCQNIIIFDCQGNPILDRGWRDYLKGIGERPNYAPGYKFTVTQPPYQSNGEGNFVLWNLGLEIKVDPADILCACPFPGILDCLKDQLAPAAEAA